MKKTLLPSDEARRIWKEKFPFYDQASFAQGMTITPSNLSELLNNKREFSLRLIRFLVATGADAEIMIRDNIIES